MTMLTDFIPAGAGTGTTSCWIIKYLTPTKIFDTDREIIYCAPVTRVCSTLCQPPSFECLASHYSHSAFTRDFCLFPTINSIDLDQSQIARKFDPIFSKRKYIHHTWTWSVLKTNNMTLFWQNRPRHQRHDTIPVRPELRCVVTVHVQCFPQMNNW